jgi:uncharacterized protein YndB with AHSA1/START domain
MTMPQPIMHTGFTIERRLKASPRHAFRFWSEPELKFRWNDCHADRRVLEDAFDFRVGGAERKHWRTSEGQDLTFTAHYLDIIPEARIIYAYEMSFAGTRLSASLVTVTFAPSGGATLMTFTEQAALLEGGAGARQQRLVGSEEGMDRLVELVDAEVVGAR